MTARGRAVLGLAVLVYAAAWVLGSQALYPVAVGLVLAVGIAAAWVRLSLRPAQVGRYGIDRTAVEGQDVRVDLVVEPSSFVPPPGIVAVDRLGRLGERSTELLRVDRRRWYGSYELQAVPRGRYPLETAALSVADPWGFAAGTIGVQQAEALVVYPRLVDVPRPFWERGPSRRDGGRRLLLRDPAGFELHGVREHGERESLRRVHWPSTARRGELMVKELEDAPDEELVVLLDGEAAGRATFDVAVRAAGSVLRSLTLRGRRAELILHAARRERRAVASTGRDWELALDLLAAAEPTARSPVAGLLEPAAGLRAPELLVVTGRLEPSLEHRLVERQRARRGTALVYVALDRRAEPALLRLHRAGIPAAVVGPGDDLAAALSAAPSAKAAGA